MPDRSDLFIAIGLVLRRLNELSEETDDTPLGRAEQVEQEVKSLKKKWKTLMKRLNSDHGMPRRKPGGAGKDSPASNQVQPEAKA